MTKGEDTRDRILDRAFRTASRDGLGGLSIGGLAGDLGLSKSGLFAHFGSKEELQIGVLAHASERFQAAVLLPAFKAPRGIPRLRKVFDLWLRWATDPALPGGCIFLAAAVELDDHESKARDYLVGAQKDLFGALAKAARIAIEAGDFDKGVDCDQLAFELFGIFAAFQHQRRLMRDPTAEKRARAAFERLMASASSRKKHDRSVK
jgi:AcrR family transcriptional regulator